ncbi:LysE family translocator [Luteimonas huabeiensis]|uniref:LysE family translocator n=1 Tax=Luteimonas huabeiensis TaxID=1244513 RepID=UPI0004653E80|nr:LysE family translocator [Luteimonas huabeiensis]
MIPPETALQFVAVAAVLALVPGPDNLFVLMQSAIRGARSGLAVTLGLCTGLIVHTTAVAFGVAALFAASALAFTALKIVGAAYLLYLAYGAFRAGATAAPAADPAAGSARALYLRGVAMNITNPKVAIFFLAFLPQFVAADRGPVAWQMLQLGALFMATSLLVFGAIAAVSGRLSGWLRRSPRAVPAMNKIAGLVFVGLAAKLATAQR